MQEINAAKIGKVVEKADLIKKESIGQRNKRKKEED